MSIYRFASFALNTARYQLTNDGASVNLPRLPMDILILLVEREGDLLTRAEIAAAIWPDSDPADVVPRINTAINRIRNSLGDDPGSPVFVQTVIGRGYRFLPPVEVEIQEEAPDISGDFADPLPAQPVERSQPGRSLWLLAIPALLALGTGGWLLGHRRVPVSAPKDPYTLTRFTSNQGEDRVTAAAISPDGRTVAYADADGLRLRGLNEIGSHPITTPPLREVDSLAWLPDNTHLMVSGVAASSDVPQVWLLSIAGTSPVLWRSGVRKATPALHGTRIAFTDASDSIWVANDLWQPPYRVFQGVPGEAFSALVWTSNGKTLLAARHQRNESTVSILDDGTMHPRSAFFAFDTETNAILTQVDNTRVDEACLEPSGTLLFSRSQLGAIGIWEVPVNPATGAFLGPARRIQVIVPTLRSISIASTGIVAAVLGSGNPGIEVGEMHLAPPSLDHIRPVVFSANGSYPHSWTPDGTGLYFEQQQEDHRYHIFKQQLGSHDPEALASLPSDQAFPLLTPDHKWILFLGRDDRSKPYELFRVSSERGLPSRVPTAGPMGEMRCPLLGTTCILRRLEDRKRVVFYRLDPLLGVGKVLFVEPWMSDDLGGWDVSPDGATLALVTSGTHGPVLRLVTLASGIADNHPVPLQSRITAVHYDVDQRGWFVTTRTATGSDLFYLDLANHATLLRHTSGLSWVVPSPTGSVVAFVDQNLDSNVWLLDTQDDAARKERVPASNEH